MLHGRAGASLWGDITLLDGTARHVSLAERLFWQCCASRKLTHGVIISLLSFASVAK